MGFDLKMFSVAGRARVLFLAYATSLLSKLVTALVQLLAFPVAARTLGVENFGAMLTLAAITSLLYIPGIGLAPAVSFAMGRSIGSGAQPCAARVFVDATRLGLFAMLLWATLGSALIAVVPAEFLFGSGASRLDDSARIGAFAMLGHVSLAYGFTFIDGARAAMNQTHISNLYALSGSALVFGLAMLLATQDAGFGWFYISIFLVPVIMQAINLAHFCIEHRVMLASARDEQPDYWSIIRPALDFTRGQVGIVLHLHGLVFILTQTVGLSAGAVSGGIVRLYMQINSLVQSVLTPLLPTLSAANAANDSKWQRTGILAILGLTWGAIPMLGVFVGLFGQQILRLWLNLDITANGVSTWAYAAWGSLSTMVLIAFSVMIALGQSKLQGSLILVSGTFGCLSALWLLQGGSTESAIWVNALFLLLGGLIIPTRSMVHIVQTPRPTEA
ncbi:hypothetical protein [Blastomonas sp. AAP53]|uniref:lipopolysaccharide biosynthesis protein n=1 Tax=Blastomonas sp. AAP53 TaxID=1248760 RepID=UPI0003732F0F|nr:hypothetical protein [Blastomonas sp. AAP53]